MSDVCFCGLLERDIWADDEIPGYFRCQDNLDAAFRGGGCTRTRPQAELLIRAKVHSWQLRLVHWMLDVESISLTEVPILGIAVGRGCGGRLHIRPYFKPASLLAPLTDISCHPAHAHWWPVSEAGKIARHNLSVHDFEAVKNRFLDSWCTHGMTSRIIKGAKTFRPKGAQESRLAEPAGRHRGGTEENSVFLVLPYHPLLSGARLIAVCARVAQAWRRELLPPQVLVPWRNGGPALHVRLRNLGLQETLGNLN